MMIASFTRQDGVDFVFLTLTNDADMYQCHRDPRAKYKLSTAKRSPTIPWI